MTLSPLSVKSTAVFQNRDGSVRPVYTEAQDGYSQWRMVAVVVVVVVVAKK